MLIFAYIFEEGSSPININFTGKAHTTPSKKTRYQGSIFCGNNRQTEQYHTSYS